MLKNIIIVCLLISISFCSESEKFYKTGIDFKYGYNEKEIDLNFAEIWFKEAANKGNIKANLELGLINYEKNIYKEAHNYFLKSYEETESKYYLSLMYENGYYVEKNKDKMIQILKVGRLKKDNPKIQLKLYEIEKKQNNYKEMYVLLKEASNLGSKEALKELLIFCEKYNKYCEKIQNE